MAFVQFSKVSLAFGDRDILKDVSINLQSGSKVALTGTNGAGKSTLIKVLAGITKPDSGNRAVQKDCRIAYLPQSGLTHHGSTLKEEADKAFEFGYELQRKIDEIGEQLKSNPAAPNKSSASPNSSSRPIINLKTVFLSGCCSLAMDAILEKTRRSRSILLYNFEGCSS